MRKKAKKVKFKVGDKVCLKKVFSASQIGVGADLVFKDSPWLEVNRTSTWAGRTYSGEPSVNIGPLHWDVPERFLSLYGKPSRPKPKRKPRVWKLSYDKLDDKHYMSSQGNKALEIYTGINQPLVDYLNSLERRLSRAKG